MPKSLRTSKNETRTERDPDKGPSAPRTVPPGFSFDYLGVLANNTGGIIGGAATSFFDFGVGIVDIAACAVPVEGFGCTPAKLAEGLITDWDGTTTAIAQGLASDVGTLRSDLLSGDPYDVSHGVTGVFLFFGTLGAGKRVPTGGPAVQSGRLRIIGNGFTETERWAAQRMSEQGYNVVLREATGRGRMSDLLLDGRAYDVYTPTTRSVDRIVDTIAKKGSQVNGGGVIVDLRGSPLRASDLDGILQRVQGVTDRVTDIKVLDD